MKEIDPEGAAWLEEACGAREAEGDLAEPGEISETREPMAPVFAQALAGSLKKEAVEYAAMTTAFVICTSSAFLRSKGLHVYSGLTWAGLTLQHMYKYRQRLLKAFGFNGSRSA